MEEQFLFTRIHDALDIPTPPGAYERLRTQLTKKPVRPFRWPALQTRWSKMSFRFAAGLAIIAIAVVAAAAAVAIHNSTNNTSPAGSRMSIQAYQRLIAADRPDPNSVWSGCDDSVHSGCLRSAQASIPLLQKWLDDITRSEPPARFATVNAEMRLHLIQNITVLNSMVVDSQARNDVAMSRDFDRAVYAVDWTGVMQTAIAQSQQVSEQTYAQRVRNETGALDACGAPCGFGSNASTCAANTGLTCADLFDTAAVSFGSYQADLVQNAAPPSMAARDMALQADLARADAVLLNMNLTATADDQAGFDSGIAQLVRIKTQIDVDTAKITG